MKKIKLFLSSTFDQFMIDRRDLFRNELRFRLEEKLGRYGIYFYLYDFEFGIPMRTKPEHVLRMCLQAVKRSNMFLGIVENEYGTPVQSFIKEKKERESIKRDFPMLAEAIDRNASVLELEFLYAMKFERKSKLFLIVNGNEEKRSDKIRRLIFKIQQSGQNYKKIVDYEDIKSKVMQWVLSIVQETWGNVKPDTLTAYAIRKTKYYVEDKQIADVYQYLGGKSRKILCIYGEQGSGKTVMAARMYMEQYYQGMCFAFVGRDIYTLSEVILVLLKQIYGYYGIPAVKLDVVYSEREYVQLFQETIKTIASYPSRCCLIIDGIEKIRIMDMFSINVIMPDKLPSNLKIVLTTSDKSLIFKKKSLFLLHKPIDRYELLTEILRAEGKQMERTHIGKNPLFHKAAETSLEYVYVLISELIASAKYNTLSSMLIKQAFQVHTLVDLYVGFLHRILSRFPNQVDYIRNLMFYLTCTENGLTEKELEILAGCTDEDVLSFVYPYLEITGERRMLISSEEFRKAVAQLLKLGEEQTRLFRRHIVNVCFKDAEEDPILGRELLYQLIHIQEETLTKHVLDNLQIVDSITYYDYEYALKQFLKFPNFKECLQNWSSIEVTENNCAYMLVIVKIELEEGMYDSAKRHLEMMHALLNENRIKQNYVGNIYNHLAVLHAKRLNYNEAQKYAKKAILEAQQNSESFEQICEYKNILCRMYLNTGHYKTAFVLGCRLLDLYSNPFYEDAVYRLRVEVTLLHILNNQDKNTEYQKKYEWLLPRLEATFGKLHSETIDVRFLNIHYLIKRGFTKQALEQCRRIKEMIKHDSRYQMELLLVESDIYYHMRDWKKEAVSLKKAGKLLGENGEKKLLEVISWYEKNMIYCMEIGQPKKAIKIGIKVQDLLGKCDGPSLYEIDNFVNMGAAYEYMGENNMSMECYENAINSLRQQKGVSGIKEAEIYNQVGSSAQNMQLYSSAYKAYRRALNILREYPETQTVLCGTILNNMGQLMQETKHASQALYFYGMALKSYRECFSEDNMHIANTLDNVGSIFDMREEYKRAAAFHLKSLQYRLKRGGLYTPSTVTSLHNLANTWYLDGKWISAYIVEGMAIQGLRKQEISVDDYPIYMCMGKVLEHMHLKHAAFRYYMQAYHLLKRKKEIVSETVEIYLILATLDATWEKNPISEKILLKASMLLNYKKQLYRKDYELRIAICFSLERYYCYRGKYEKALGYLNSAEEVIECKLDRNEYKDICEMISTVRKEIEDCMEG